MKKVPKLLKYLASLTFDDFLILTFTVGFALVWVGLILYTFWRIKAGN